MSNNNKGTTNYLIVVVLALICVGVAVQISFLAKSYKNYEEKKELDLPPKHQFYENAETITAMQRHLEETSTDSLDADQSFVNSKEYKEMEAHIRANYDIDKLRSQFEEKGFIIFDPKIPKDVLASAKAFTQEVWDTCIAAKHKPSSCRSYHQDRFVDQEGVKDLAQDYTVRSMLAVLHGHEPYPFQTLNYPMTSLARTHSDYIHFAGHPLPLMSACWVALMDISPDAGPVFYYEGSHKIPPYNMQDFGLEDRDQHPLNYAKYQDIMTTTMKKLGYEYKEATIPEGWALIWSANLIHGGPPPRKKGKQRLSQVTHYFFRNSNYNWAPVASDVEKNKILYYNEWQIDMKWSNQGFSWMRRLIPKFRWGTCTTYTSDVGRSDLVSPCSFYHGIPKVMSDIFQHKGEPGNDVIM